MNRIITICCIFLSFVTFAQSNFVDASITKLNGETIAGKIDYREWLITPNEIKFQPAATPAIIETYTPTDLSGFKIHYNNEEYKRAIVGINNEPTSGDGELTRIESLEELQKPLKLDVDTVFLLILVKGRVNLYTLYDEQKQHYFIQKSNGRIEELIYRVVLVKNFPQSGAVSIAGSEAFLPGSSYSGLVFEDYKRQLVEAMPDCPNIQTSINKVGYSYNLKSVVEEYNKCVGALIYVKPKDKAKSFIYAYAGAAKPFFTFQDANLDNAQYLSSSLTPSFGLGFDIGIIRSLNKISLGLEANYIAAKANASTRYEPFDGMVKISDYNFDVQGIRFNMLLKYVFFNKTLYPYIKAGIGGSSYFQADYVKTVRLEASPFTSTSTQKELIQSELHGVLGIGLTVNNFFLESRYELSNDINRFTNEDLKMKRLSLLAGYSLPFNK
ncbi:MAG: hypothetical protein SFU99_21055 [Saprospiraceae bacterium]|nr:hypothetical protein [Saprospiraceae bacterium]